MSTVRLSRVSKRYGTTVAVHELDLDVADGELVTLLGPSGCGKTTTLRMLAGLIEPSSGRVWFDDEDVTYVPPRTRNIGFVFQTPALFPHLSVARNIAFGLSVKGAKRGAIDERVAEMLALVGLAGYGERMPSQLSGGQQQRVALARALIHEPRLVICDEPTAALDHASGEAVMSLLAGNAVHPDRAVIVVTHDTRVFHYAQSIAHMDDGRIANVTRKEA